MLGYRWKLHLYCEAPGAWHQTGADGYAIDDMPGWLAAVAPYLNPLIIGLKAVVPVAAALSADLKVMQELVKKLPDIREAHPGRDFDKAAHHDEARTYGAALQELHAFLRAQAPDGPWGALSKVLTPEGDYLWLCPRHAKKLAR